MKKCIFGKKHAISQRSDILFSRFSKIYSGDYQKHFSRYFTHFFDPLVSKADHKASSEAAHKILALFGLVVLRVQGEQAQPALRFSEARRGPRRSDSKPCVRISRPSVSYPARASAASLSDDLADVLFPCFVEIPELPIKAAFLRFRGFAVSSIRSACCRIVIVFLLLLFSYRSCNMIISIFV